jgi:hypothetical protein
MAILLGLAIVKMEKSEIHAVFMPATKMMSFILPQFILPLAAFVFIPSLPVYQNFTFVLLVIFVYSFSLVSILMFNKHFSLMNRNLFSLTLVLIGIKFILVHGFMSEPLQRERRTRAISNYIVQICKNHPVYTTGAPEQIDLSLQIGPFQWKESKYKPPLIAYQIPLYYYENTGQLIQYREKILAKGCYLKKNVTVKSYVEPGIKKNSFVDPWTYTETEIILKN